MEGSVIYPNSSQNLGEGKKVIARTINNLMNECREYIADKDASNYPSVTEILKLLETMRPNPLAFPEFTFHMAVVDLSRECGWDSRPATIGWAVFDLHRDLNRLSRMLDEVDFGILQVNIDKLKDSVFLEEGTRRSYDLVFA